MAGLDGPKYILILLPCVCSSSQGHSTTLLSFKLRSRNQQVAACVQNTNWPERTRPWSGRLSQVSLALGFPEDAGGGYM